MINLRSSKGAWSPNASAMGMFKSSMKEMMILFLGAPNRLLPFFDSLDTNMLRNFFDVVLALNCIMFETTPVTFFCWLLLLWCRKNQHFFYIRIFLAYALLVIISTSW